jgi:hypothetical protein
MLVHERLLFWHRWGPDWGTVYAIRRLWRWHERTYGALGAEGPSEAFVASAIKDPR